MQLEFFGGAQEVGKSAILLTDGKRLLLDYGVKVGGTKAEYPKNVGHVDGVVLSHAHLDHSGAIPVVYNNALSALHPQ